MAVVVPIPRGWYDNRWRGALLLMSHGTCPRSLSREGADVVVVVVVLAAVMVMSGSANRLLVY
jgi:hypothetical protein